MKFGGAVCCNNGSTKVAQSCVAAVRVLAQAKVLSCSFHRPELSGSLENSVAMAVNVALSCYTASNQAPSSRTVQSLAEWRNNGTEFSRAYAQLRPGFRASSSFRQQSIISLNSSVQSRTLLLANDGDFGLNGSTGRSAELWRLVPKATVAEEQQPEQSSIRTSPTLKDFLEELKPLGRVRLIVNTGVAVLESVTSFEKLFYHAGPRGEYANIMSRDDNVDFHLLLEKVALVRLVEGKSMKGDIPTYMVRLVDVNDTAAVSVLVMWRLGTDGEYDPGQVEAFQALVEKYGEEYKFSASS